MDKCEEINVQTIPVSGTYPDSISKSLIEQKILGANTGATRKLSLSADELIPLSKESAELLIQGSDNRFERADDERSFSKTMKFFHLSRGKDSKYSVALLIGGVSGDKHQTYLVKQRLVLNANSTAVTMAINRACSPEVNLGLITRELLARSAETSEHRSMYCIERLPDRDGLMDAALRLIGDMGISLERYKVDLDWSAIALLDESGTPNDRARSFICENGPNGTIERIFSNSLGKDVEIEVRVDERDLSGTGISTNTQRIIQQNVAKGNDLLLTGGPGVGKTAVAIQTAMQVVSDGKTFLFTSQNSMAINTFSSRLQEVLDFSKSRHEVQSKILELAGMKVIPEQDLSAINTELNTHIETLEKIKEVCSEENCRLWRQLSSKELDIQSELLNLPQLVPKDADQAAYYIASSPEVVRYAEILAKYNWIANVRPDIDVDTLIESINTILDKGGFLGIGSSKRTIDFSRKILDGRQISVKELKSTPLDVIREWHGYRLMFSSLPKQFIDYARYVAEHGGLDENMHVRDMCVAAYLERLEADSGLRYSRKNLDSIKRRITKLEYIKGEQVAILVRNRCIEAARHLVSNPVLKNALLTECYTNEELLEKFSEDIEKYPLLAVPIDNIGLLDIVADSIDWVCFDEASQIYVYDSIPALYLAKNVCVIGDQDQLPPNDYFKKNIEFGYRGSDASLPSQINSFMGVCLAYHRHCFLDITLRFERRELFLFPQTFIYHGKVKSLAGPEPDNADPPISVITVDGCWVNQSNSAVITKLPEVLVDVMRTYPDSSLAVVANSSRMAEDAASEIRKYIRGDTELGAWINSKKDFGVFNTENIQSAEWDIIIFLSGFGLGPDGEFHRSSLTAFNNPAGHTRLNVPITRCKKKLIVIDSTPSGGLDYQGYCHPGPMYYAKFLDHCHALSEGNLEKDADILDRRDLFRPSDELTASVYSRFLVNGWSVRTDVAIGDWRIDLLVSDGNKSVAVNFDLTDYPSTSNSWDTDIFIPDFLTRYGIGQTFRILSVNIYHEGFDSVMNDLTKKLRNYFDQKE